MKKKQPGFFERLDLEVFSNRHPASLSGGQKQRLAIASAVAAERPVIFLDEPTRGLDYRHMLDVAGLMKALCESGKTVYVITHAPEFICECCTDIIHLERGIIKENYPMDAAGTDKIRRFFRTVCFRCTDMTGVLMRDENMADGLRVNAEPIYFFDKAVVIIIRVNHDGRVALAVKENVCNPFACTGDIFIDPAVYSAV